MRASDAYQHESSVNNKRTIDKRSRAKTNRRMRCCSSLIEPAKVTAPTTIARIQGKTDLYQSTFSFMKSSSLSAAISSIQISVQDTIFLEFCGDLAVLMQKDEIIKIPTLAKVHTMSNQSISAIA